MFARSTTIQANPASIDEGIAHVRDVVLPELMQMEGCIGLSMMVDRQGGRCIATSAWQSAEARQASAMAVMPLRDRAAEILGGESAVELWDIAVMHRDHPTHDGACIRATWLSGDPSMLDDGISSYRMVALPQMESIAGFCSASLMVNRETGNSVSSVCYESREAMDASRQQADEMRARIAEQAGVRVMEVAEFELAVAHLRVPEMA